MDINSIELFLETFHRTEAKLIFLEIKMVLFHENVSVLAEICCHNTQIFILRIELENVNMVANRRIITGSSRSNGSVKAN